MDALSAWFAGVILLLTTLAAFYASGYLREVETKSHAIRVFWFHYLLLTASMLVVVTARNGILFLLAWEPMALTSFFLVIFDHEQSTVRRAGWIYFTATHIGTTCVLFLFALLGRSAGSLDFASFFAFAPSSQVAAVIFVLAVIGFGTKVGLCPCMCGFPKPTLRRHRRYQLCSPVS